ncbi:MAG: DeoR/GlpR family DNA-binding transcription regulator [bacterium]
MLHNNNYFKDTESYIIHLLEIHNRVSVNDLCNMFDLAPSTIRKKLAEMEKEGLLIRTHGGAISIDANRDEPIDKKSLLNIPQKKAIAAAGVEFISKGDVIALGGGSTIAELCVYLLKLKGSIVLTNSIAVANLLMPNKDLEVRVSGGIVRGRTGCIVGPDSDRLFRDSKADKAFVGCDTFNLKDGACSANILVGEVERNLLCCAKERYVLCDSSKLNKSTIFSVMKINELTALVTDDDADPYYINNLREEGLEVIVVPVFRTKHIIPLEKY